MIRPMPPAANIISSPLIPMMRRLRRLAIPWGGGREESKVERRGTRASKRRGLLAQSLEAVPSLDSRPSTLDRLDGSQPSTLNMSSVRFLLVACLCLTGCCVSKTLLSGNGNVPTGTVGGTTKKRLKAKR